MDSKRFRKKKMGFENQNLKAKKIEFYIIFKQKTTKRKKKTTLK